MAWTTQRESPDPIRAEIQCMRAEAEYLRKRWGDEKTAQLLDQQAGRWEDIFEQVRRMDVPYAQAAEISIYELGTIRNKVSSGELDGGHGKVSLGRLPICPSKAPDLHAAVAMERIRDTSVKDNSKEAEAPDSPRARARDAHKRFSAV